MSVFHSFVGGFGKVQRSPSLLVWVYLVSLVLTVPLAISMRSILQDSIGDSLVHENLRQGFDRDWYGEFSEERSGLAETFGPSVVGILPVLSNFERLLDGEILQAQGIVLAAGVVFLLAWAFFAGGILDRFYHGEEHHSRARLFSQSGIYFFRNVRLLIISVALYWVIFRLVATPLHDWVEDATRDVTAERTVMLWTLAVYAVVGFLLVLAGMILDYAKISLVAEKRRSSLLAFLRGVRFVASHPAKTFGLYLLLLVVGAVLVYLYSLVAPGPGQATTLAILGAFLVGQVYILARVGLKLWFLAGQTELFQSAHL